MKGGERNTACERGGRSQECGQHLVGNKEEEEVFSRTVTSSGGTENEGDHGAMQLK